MVALSLFVEFYNVCVTGFEITRLSYLSAKKSCDLICMETYKREDFSSINLQDLRDLYGNLIVSGNFYGDKTPDQIYEEMYVRNTEYIKWAKENEGNWSNLMVLNYGMGISDGRELSRDEKELGKEYYNEKITPLNLGIIYLKKDLFENIAKWNIAAIFSSGKAANLKFENGRKYVLFKGFRIYVDTLRVQSIDYEVVNVLDNPEKFIEITGMDPSKLGFDFSNYEKCNVNIAYIKYNMDIGYEGITPLKRLIEFASNQGNVADNGYKTQDKQVGASINMGVGFGKKDKSNLVPDRLIYYLVQ